jgi:hypothetical protein
LPGAGDVLQNGGQTGAGPIWLNSGRFCVELTAFSWIGDAIAKTIATAMVRKLVFFIESPLKRSLDGPVDKKINSIPPPVLAGR